VEQRAVAGKSLVRQVKAAGKIPALRALDLDDLGPEVGQTQCTRGPGQKLAEIQDQETL
jgi:hypothetical protein